MNGPHRVLGLILLAGYLLAGVILTGGVIGALVGLHYALGGGR